MPQWTLVTAKGCEDNAALRGVVAVVQHEARHVGSLVPMTTGDIDGYPETEP